MKYKSFTAQKIADIFGVSRTTVSRWRKNGKLDYYKIPSGHGRSTMDDLERFAGEFNMMPLLIEYLESLEANEADRGSK